MKTLVLATALLAGCASPRAGDEWLIHAFSKAAVWKVKDAPGTDGSGM